MPKGIWAGHRLPLWYQLFSQPQWEKFWLLIGFHYLQHTMLNCWRFFFYGISGIWSSCLQLQSKMFSFTFLLAICTLLHTSGCQLALFHFIIPNTAVISFLSLPHTSAKHTGQFLLDNMLSAPAFYYFLPSILSTWFFLMASTQHFLTRIIRTCLWWGKKKPTNLNKSWSSCLQGWFRCRRISLIDLKSNYLSW